MAVFWVVAPCSLVEVYQRFRGPCCLHYQGDSPVSYLKLGVDGRTCGGLQPLIWKITCPDTCNKKSFVITFTKYAKLRNEFSTVNAYEFAALYKSRLYSRSRISEQSFISMYSLRGYEYVKFVFIMKCELDNQQDIRN
jgi:hypothetical protein